MATRFQTRPVEKGFNLRGELETGCFFLFHETRAQAQDYMTGAIRLPLTSINGKGRKKFDAGVEDVEAPRPLTSSSLISTKEKEVKVLQRFRRLPLTPLLRTHRQVSLKRK